MTGVATIPPLTMRLLSAESTGLINTTTVTPAAMADRIIHGRDGHGMRRTLVEIASHTRIPTSTVSTSIGVYNVRIEIRIGPGCCVQSAAMTCLNNGAA